MENQSETSKVPNISKRTKLLLIPAGILLILLLPVLMSPLGLAGQSAQDGPDYNLLIQESKDNSEKWEALEREQKILETRNAEIQVIVCETGVCAFQ